MLDEHALSPSDDTLRQVIEATTNAMVLVNERGNILLVNRQTEALFGYERSELLSMQLERLIPERFRATHPKFRDGFFQRPDTRAMGAGRDLYGLHRDGTEVPIEIGLNPLPAPQGGTLVLASIIDITERKRAEERLSLLVEAAPNAMVMVDASGSIVLVNTETERAFGYDREALLSMNVDQLIPQRFRHHHEGFRRGFFDKPGARSMGEGRDLFGLRSDGTEIPIEIGLNPIQVMGDDLVLASIIDITGRLQVQAVQAAEEANRLRSSMLDSLPFSSIAMDCDGLIVTANPAAEEMLGYGRLELVGSAFVDRLDSSELEACRAELERGGLLLPDAGFSVLQAVTLADPEADRECTYRRRDGSAVPVNQVVTPMYEDDSLSGYLAVAYDITLRREAEAYIHHMAMHDDLTDLPNRTSLEANLEAAISRASLISESVAVLVIDLDHFKRVNDSLGHHIGDELLLMMAQRLRECLREGDFVARFGGDEFVVVLADAAKSEQLADRTSELLSTLAQPIDCSGHELMVTASVGGAFYPGDGTDSATLLKNADTAMYHAKSSGRSTFRWFEQSLLDETNDKIALAAALRNALATDELSVHYQPQVSMKTGEVVGVEALARWKHPVMGDIGPARFIPVAEDNGLILQLGEWVLRTACHDAMRLSEVLGRPLRLAVNVSPRQFRSDRWPSVLSSALADSGFDPKNLDLEITEGIFMEYPRAVLDIMMQVRELGTGIVVDDFGTGFSSLAYLTRFPISKIKIDRSFVMDVTSDDADAAIVDTIIAMAHTLNMEVVAEGIETREQEDYLRERGCDEAQGFLYSEAIDVSVLSEALVVA